MFAVSSYLLDLSYNLCFIYNGLSYYQLDNRKHHINI